MSPRKKFHLFSFPCFGHLVPGLLDFQTGAPAAQQRANSPASVFLPFRFQNPHTAPHGGLNCGRPPFLCFSGPIPENRTCIAPWNRPLSCSCLCVLQIGGTAAQRRANSPVPVFLPFQFRNPQTAPHGGSNRGYPLFFVSADQFLKTGLAFPGNQR